MIPMCMIFTHHGLETNPLCTFTLSTDELIQNISVSIIGQLNIIILNFFNLKLSAFISLKSKLILL